MNSPVLPNKRSPIKLERHTLRLQDIDGLQSFSGLESRFINLQFGVQVIVRLHRRRNPFTRRVGGVGFRRGWRVLSVHMRVVDCQDLSGVGICTKAVSQEVASTISILHTDDWNKVQWMGIQVVFGPQPRKQEALLQSTIRESLINTDTPTCKPRHECLLPERAS